MKTTEVNGQKFGRAIKRIQSTFKRGVTRRPFQLRFQGGAHPEQGVVGRAVNICYKIDLPEHLFQKMK